MMPTLLLRLAGPLQSWGKGSRFDFRDTDTVPTKSGVVGLIASAMGIERQNQKKLAKLAKLRMGVLVESEGKLLVDYHTVMGAIKADGSCNEKETIQSYRQYLCDAEFLVGLESDNEEQLKEIEYYLCFPKWQLFLGRKACPPSKPIFVNIVPTQLDVTLKSPDILLNCGVKHKKGVEKYRLILQDDDNPKAALRLDVPIDFEKRIFSVRKVHTCYVEVPDVSQ